MSIRNPVIIIGAARSGTSVLGKALALHPDIAYLQEPNVIWRYRNADYQNDAIPVDRLTDEIKAYIRAKFAAFLRQQGKSRLLEKTPSNSLRLAFVRAVFPDARIIYIIRDGRDVSLSASRKWQTETDPNKELLNTGSLFPHLRLRVRKFFQIPFRDLPYYLHRIISDILFHAGLRQRKIWGPRFPGIEEAIKNHSVVETCALQWQACVEAVEKDKAGIPADDFFELKYEDLCADPHQHIVNILNFANLAIPGNLEEIVSLVQPVARKPWDAQLSEQERASVLRLIQPTLEKLGYK